MRFLSVPILLLGIACNGAAQTLETSEAATDATPATTPELVRVQNLIRANVLDLAQEILETRGPAVANDPGVDAGINNKANITPSTEWLRWERQLWALYQVRGQWQKLYERIARLPPGLPKAIQRESQLLTIKALTALHRFEAARAIIRKKLVATDAPQLHKRRLRQALIAAYLADGLLAEARIAMRHFRRDYGVGEADWLLLSAGVLLRSGDPGAAINLLAPLQQPAARLLRLYARLGNRSLTPEQVIKHAVELKALPSGKGSGTGMAREIQAVIAQANLSASQIYPLTEVLEDYLLAPAAADPSLSRVYPQFGVDDLLAVYARIATEEGNQAGLLIGEESRWLAHAQQSPPNDTATRKSLFAYLALAAKNPQIRQSAVDGYVNILIDLNRTELIKHLFGADARLGELILGGATGLRLSAHALKNGNFQLAADANATLSALPAGVRRMDWLLQAGRIDIFAGRHRQGVAKLTEWLNALNSLQPAQADAILQPIFDLQTVEKHSLALALLHMVDARAPAGKYRREIAYWLAESYHARQQYHTAADLFLHSALQQADGFDRWGEAARFRAAESLLAGKLFADARRLFEDLLSRAKSATRRSALQQKLQRVWLLESSHLQSSLLPSSSSSPPSPQNDAP